LRPILGKHRGNARVEFGSVGDQLEDPPISLVMLFSYGCEIRPETVRS
jgi:hypothetical protein